MKTDDAQRGPYTSLLFNRINHHFGHRLLKITTHFLKDILWLLTCVFWILGEPSVAIRSPTAQLSSVTQLCPTLWDPMDCSSPGLPVHRQIAEFTQTHVHWIGDAIQPSHPLSAPSPSAFNLSQHQKPHSRR